MASIMDERQTQIARIVQLNNEAAQLLVTSAVHGRQAMVLLQGALVVASTLVDGMHHHNLMVASAGAESLRLETGEHWFRLCKSVAVPLLRCDSNKGAGLYMYTKALFLQDAVPSATKSTNHAILLHTARLSEVYIPALLLNFALAYLQLGRAYQCSSGPKKHAPSLFQKACQLYARLPEMAQDQRQHLQSKTHDWVRSPLSVWNLAAWNNLCLLRLELGQPDASRQAHANLLQSVVLQGLPLEHQVVVREFWLNATTLTVTGFLRNLGAPLA